MSYYDDRNRWQEPDGTWSVTVVPWCNRIITGIRSKEEAEKLLDIINDAMNERSRNDRSEF